MNQATTGASHSEILENIILVAAPLNLFSPERDTGERKTEDLVTNKRTIQFVEPKLLAPFRSKRTELRRMLLAFGSRLPLFGAYAVPAKNIGHVTQALEAFTREWETLRAEFVRDYPASIQHLKAEHPARAAEISRFAPMAGELLKQMEFRWTTYEVRMDSIRSESGLSSELLSLPERVMEDIAKELNERTGKGMQYRQAVRDVLGRVREKAEGFAFLHPVIAAIPEAIDKTLAALPKEGAILGSDAIMLGGLIGALQNRRILEVGIVTVSNIQERLEAEEKAAEAAVSEALQEEIPEGQTTPAATGTWDF